MRRSAQKKKKSEGVSICPVGVQHLARQLSQPSRLGLSYSFSVVWCTAVCVCARVGMHAMLFIVQCVHVLTHVTYNTAQVKMGQNSRRAAWADLGVAPRVCAVVSISTDVTGLRPIFLCLDYTAGPGNEVGGIVLNFISSTEHV